MGAMFLFELNYLHVVVADYRQEWKNMSALCVTECANKNNDTYSGDRSLFTPKLNPYTLSRLQCTHSQAFMCSKTLNKHLATSIPMFPICLNTVKKNIWFACITETRPESIKFLIANFIWMQTEMFTIESCERFCYVLCSVIKIESNL